MGIHDREYYRDESRESYATSHWTMVTKVIIVTVAFYVLNLFIGNSHWLMRNMAVSTETLKTPYLWWQFLAAGFAHDYRDVTHLFWNMFGLWIFGRQVEDVYGPKEFLRFYLIAIILGSVGWAIRANLTGTPDSMFGASGAVTAVTLLFCIHFPKQTILFMMVLPVPAWLLGVLIVGGDLLGMQMNRERVAFDVHLIGAAFAILYYRFGWNFGRWLPGFSMPRWQLFSRRPKLRVHRPREEFTDDFEQLEARADQLLEKVNRDGIDSLSPKEQQILEDYSRRMRDRRL